MLEEDRRVSVNAFARALGTGRVGFGPEDDLMAQLGVAPGSVTPFGLVNARPGAVRPIFDCRLMEAFEWVHFHPLTNAMTTAIRPADLLRFLRQLGHAPEVVEPPPAPG